MFDEFEVDGLLAIRVNKSVILRDRWLGITQLAGMLAIVMFFVVQRMYNERAYLKLHPLTGAVDSYFKNPHEEDKRNFSNWQYCEEYLGDPPSSSKYAQMPCVNLPLFTLSHGSSSNAMFFATRIVDTSRYDLDCLQTQAFSTSETDCKMSKAGPKTYIANSEYYRFLMRHAVTPIGDYHMTPPWLESQSIPGYLECGDGIRRTLTPYFTSSGREYDDLRIYDILDCAGIHLDDLSSDGRPVRLSGVNIVIEIVYQHDWMGNLVSYEYHVIHLPLKTLMYVSETEKLNDSQIQSSAHPASHSDFEARVGVRMHLKIAGAVAEPDFSQFMIAWVSTMALLGLVNLLLQFLMRHVLPLRHFYIDMTEQRSPNVAHFRKGDKYAVEAANSVLKQKAIHSGQNTYHRYQHHMLSDSSYRSRQAVEFDHEAVKEAAIVEIDKGRRQDIPQQGCMQDKLSDAAIEEAVLSHVTKLVEEIRQDVKADIQGEQDRFRVECDAHLDRLICKLDSLMQSPPCREADQETMDVLHVHTRLLAVETAIKSMKESSRAERQNVKDDRAADLPETGGRQEVKDMLHLHASRLLSMEAEIKAIKELPYAENQGAKGDPAASPPASMRQSLPFVEDSGVVLWPNIEMRFSELERRLLANTSLVEEIAHSSDLTLYPKSGNTSLASFKDHRTSEIDLRTGISHFQFKETTDDEKRWAAIDLHVRLAGEFFKRLTRLEEQHSHLRDQFGAIDWVLEHTRAQEN